MANKLVTVEQLDAAVDGFAAEIKAQDFEKAANLKSLAYADAVSSMHVASSLTTILAGKLSNADAANLVAGEVGMTYRPGGSYEFANLPAPSATTYGMVYNVVDDFVTDTHFAEGEGKSYKSGSEVGVVLAEKADPADPDVYVYNVFSGFVDVSKFASQSSFTTFKAALDDLEVASSTDIQNLIDGLALEEQITWPPQPGTDPGLYSLADRTLETSWEQFKAAGWMSEENGVLTAYPNNVAPNTSAYLILPEGGTTILPNPIIGGVNVSNIYVPEGYTTLGDMAFGNDNSTVKEVYLPTTIATVDPDAFKFANQAVVIHYNGPLDDATIKGNKATATVVRS